MVGALYYEQNPFYSVKICFIRQIYFDKSFDNDILNHCQADW